MHDNVNIFRKITHATSGKEIDSGFLLQGSYVERMDLTCPKLMLMLQDHGKYLTNTCNIKEYDEIKVAFGDQWRKDGENLEDTFVVLTVKPMPGDILNINALSKQVYELKKTADKTRVFSRRGIPDIIQAFLNGLKPVLGKFPCVENYHVIAGERPSTMLTQMSDEMGSEIWIARGQMHMDKFSELFAKPGKMTFEEGKAYSKAPILKYSRPSGQMAAQEKKIRKFTGWNEEQGRIATNTQMPILKKAGSKPTQITGSSQKYVLGTGPVARKTAIDFVTLGNMSITVGDAINLKWYTSDPQNPINEGMPAKVVVEACAHWYDTQKYYTRVKGAVALEPF